MVNKSLKPASVSGDESLAGVMLQAPSQAWRHSSCACNSHAEQHCALWGAKRGAPMGRMWLGSRRCAEEPVWRQGAPGLLECLVQPPPLLLARALRGHSRSVTHPPTSPYSTLAPRASWRDRSAWPLWPGDHAAPSCQHRRCQGNIRTGRAGGCQDSERCWAVSSTAARARQEELPV